MKPITFKFALITCSGLQVAEFDISLILPVGDAYVIWWVAASIPSSVNVANWTIGSVPVNAVLFAST